VLSTYFGVLFPVSVSTVPSRVGRLPTSWLDILFLCGSGSTAEVFPDPFFRHEAPKLVSAAVSFETFEVRRLSRTVVVRRPYCPMALRTIARAAERTASGSCSRSHTVASFAKSGSRRVFGSFGVPVDGMLGQNRARS
jgi:hypothetical protein